MHPLIYIVHLDRTIEFPDGGSTDFVVLENPKAAVRWLKRNPKFGQIDICGIDRRGPYDRYYWKYWYHGKVVTQRRPRHGRELIERPILQKIRRFRR